MIKPNELNSNFITLQTKVTRKPSSVISAVGCVKCASEFVDLSTVDTTDIFYFFVPKNINLISSEATLRVVPQTSYQWCDNESYIGKPQALGIKINDVDVTIQLGGPWNSVETLTLTEINLSELYRYVLPGINKLEAYGGSCAAGESFHVGNIQLFITFNGIVTGNL